MLDSQVLAFTVFAAILTMTPGADTLLVVRNTLRGGRRDGYMTMAGVCCGLYVHAFYLVWLGLHSLRAAAGGRPPLPVTAAGTARVPASRSFREGFLTNVLNPKVAVFYLALLPQFIGPEDPVLQKSLLLTTIHFVQGILWLGGVAFLVDRSRRFFVKPMLRRLLDAVCGTILVALGVRLAWERA